MLQDLYRHLAQITDPSVEEAMTAALPTADALGMRLIALHLLQSQTDSSQVALIKHYHLFPAEMRPMVAQQVCQSTMALHQAAMSTDNTGPGNILRIIRDRRDGTLAYLVVEILRAGSLELRPDAARCLLELARPPLPPLSPLSPLPPIPTLSTPSPLVSLAATTSSSPNNPSLATATTTWPAQTNAANSAMLAKDRELVETAVYEAVRHFNHHKQPAVLLALMAMAPKPIGNAADFSDTRQLITTTARHLMTQADQQASRRALLTLMSQPALSDAALHGLEKLRAVSDFGDVMAAMPLYLPPQTQHTLLRLEETAYLLPTPERLMMMLPHQTRLIGRWIGYLPIDTGQRITSLGILQQATDPMTRLNGLRPLLAMLSGPDRQAALTAIALYTNDPDPTIARIALRSLIRVNWAGLPKLLASLINSAHPSLRDIASQHLGPLGFARLWNAWPRLNEEQRLAAGRALIKIDPYFARHISGKLAQRDRRGRMRALSMVLTLNQGPMFEATLLAFAEDRDPVVVACAARILGTIRTPESVKALEKLLQHDDARARANAVESLDMLDATGHATRLMEIAQDDEGRPRANAIKALLRMDTSHAVSSLAAMLTDSRAAQRISALWLVEHMGILDVARQVAEMSLTDADGKVKQRADSVIRQLLKSVRQQAPEPPPRDHPQEPPPSASRAAG